jgi:thiamine-phosphate pyrophosphorylase
VKGDPGFAARLASAKVYLVLSRGLCRVPPAQVLAAALDGGVDVVQVREPGMADGALVEWVKEVGRIARPRGVPVIVNDRPDVARIGGADGVHVGQGDLPVSDVVELFGRELLIGFSTHSRAQVEHAAGLPVDYLGLGPVFDTPTKGLSGKGLELVRDALPRATKPAFLIGGITPENAPLVRAAGGTRVAVSSAVCSARDPAEAARSLRRALG